MGVHPNKTTMKKYITLPLLSALALTLGAGQAAADDEALYAIGGFIGGVITEKVLNHHRDHRVVYTERHCEPRHDKHGHYKHGHKKHRCDHACGHYKDARGHYKTIEVREWVPGRWEVYYDRCGDRVREWRPGYHNYVKKRVWVEQGNHGRGRGYGHEYAYR
jgi:hypothetical protein